MRISTDVDGHSDGSHSGPDAVMQAGQAELDETRDRTMDAPGHKAMRLSDSGLAVVVFV
jgi:hypothetical protein